MAWFGRFLEFLGLMLVGEGIVLGLWGGQAGFRLEMQLFLIGSGCFLLGYGLSRRSRGGKGV